MTKQSLAIMTKISSVSGTSDANSFIPVAEDTLVILSKDCSIKVIFYSKYFIHVLYIFIN